MFGHIEQVADLQVQLGTLGHRHAVESENAFQPAIVGNALGAHNQLRAALYCGAICLAVNLGIAPVAAKNLHGGSAFDGAAIGTGSINHPPLDFTTFEYYLSITFNQILVSASIYIAINGAAFDGHHGVTFDVARATTIARVGAAAIYRLSNVC